MCKHFFRNSRSAMLLLAVSLFVGLGNMSQAQTLYKYVDKNGKVSYSDKPPKDGEKATKVTIDPNANITKLNTKDSSGREQKFSDVKARGDARIAARDKLQADIRTAETDLEKAKKALEEGREPKEEERRIIVGKGGNAVQRTPEYLKRIEGLEESVKKAEEQLKTAVNRYQREKPD
jgi:Domain of unknown function (DUF4124)